MDIHTSIQKRQSVDLYPIKRWKMYCQPE